MVGLRINNDFSVKIVQRKKYIKVHEILLLRTHPLLHELFFVFPSTFLFLRSCLILFILSSFYTPLFFSLSFPFLQIVRVFFLCLTHYLRTPSPIPLQFVRTIRILVKRGPINQGYIPSMIFFILLKLFKFIILII